MPKDHKLALAYLQPIYQRSKTSLEFLQVILRPASAVISQQSEVSDVAMGHREQRGQNESHGPLPAAL